MKKLYQCLKSSWALDTRSLALFRVCFGLILAFDIAFRSLELVAHYSDAGLLPRSLFLSELANSWNFSIYLASGDRLGLCILFLIHFILTLFFLFGWYTRLTTVVLWFFYASLHNRQWLVNSSGDDMIRLLLFISFFLPLAASYSVDSALSENKKNTKNYSSLWSFIFCLQLAAVYLVSFFSKNHPIWNQEYSAIYYALHLEMFVTHFGLWLGQFKVFGQWLTYLVYYAELIGGTLVILSLFLGRYAQPVRLVASLALIIFHLGLILTMKLGTFPYVMIAAWLVFIPSSFWDFLFKKLELVKKFQLQIFYDGECSFCKKTVFMLKTFFLLPSVRARECQSQEEVLQLMTKENSWVVINHKNEKLTKLDAMIAFWRASPILSPFTFLISNPLFYVLGTKAYVWVSYNRKIMGKITSIFHWKKEFEFRKYKIFSLVMGVVYLICTYQWNMLEVNSKYSLLRYVNAREVTRYLQLFQNWKMFSPYPQTNTAWFVFQGHFKDKKVWDLVRNQAVSFEKPQKLLSEEFSSKFWRKYFNNMERDPKLARYLSLYLCRENLGNLVEIKVYKLSQNNNFMNGAEPISETMILSQKCP